MGTFHVVYKDTFALDTMSNGPLIIKGVRFNTTIKMRGRFSKQSEMQRHTHLSRNGFLTIIALERADASAEISQTFADGLTLPPLVRETFQTYFELFGTFTKEPKRKSK